MAFYVTLKLTILCHLQVVQIFVKMAFYVTLKLAILCHLQVHIFAKYENWYYWE